MLRPVDVYRVAAGCFGVGGQQRHTAPRQMLHAKGLHIPGGRHHRTVEILPHAAALIHIEEGHCAPLKQLNLVPLAFLDEVGQRVVQGPFPLVKGQILRHDAAHFSFYSCHISLG